MLPPGAPIPIRLTRAAVLRLVLVAAGGALLLLATTALLSAERDTLSAYAWWGLLASQLSFVGERSLAVWFAGLLLIFAAAGFALCYLAEAAEGGRRRARIGWLVIAAAFLLLSLDETGSLHERIGELSWLNALGDLSYTWAGVLAIPVAACAAALAVFAWRRVRHEPLVIGLLLTGAALFASVLLHEEVETRQWAERYEAAQAAGVETPPRPWEMAVFEEGTELAATLAFISAGLIHAHRVSRRRRRLRRGFGAVNVTVTAAELRAGARVLMAALAVGLLAAAALHFVLPEQPRRGDPLPWFGAVAAFCAGLAAWLVPRRTAPFDPAGILAVACLFWSAELGAGMLQSDQIWDGSPRAQLAARVILAAGTAAVAVLLHRRPPVPGVRPNIAAWGVLAAVAPLSAHPVTISALLFAAHAQLLLALVAALSSAAAPPLSAHLPVRPTPPAATA